MNEIYYKGIKIEEDDIFEISEELKVPNDVVAELVAQAKKGIEPDLNKYTGALRVKTEELVENLNTESYDIAPAPLDEDTKLVQRASNQLIQAMINPEEGYFMLDDKGVCLVNKNNPPTLEASYKAIMNVVKLGELKENLESSQCWMLGSMVIELEDLHGEAFNIGQVVSQDTRSYNTVQTATSVYREFRDKRYNVHFTHHKEAWHIKAPNEIKHLILKKAESVKLSAKEVRGLGTFYKDHENEESIRAIKTREQAQDLIKANEDSRLKYYVYNEGEWTRKTATKTSPPKGRIVIDTKNHKVSLDGETFTDIQIVNKRV